MTNHSAPSCKRCGKKMMRGTVLSQTWRRGLDRTRDGRGETARPGGAGKMQPCWKCPGCGYSTR